MLNYDEEAATPLLGEYSRVGRTSEYVRKGIKVFLCIMRSPPHGLTLRFFSALSKFQAVQVTFDWIQNIGHHDPTPLFKSFTLYCLL